MASKRKQASKEVAQHEAVPFSFEGKISSVFGENVFHTEIMREYLTSEAYKSVIETIETGATLDRRVADQVATAMKDWAMTKGVTHYTHWFQPLTGTTAEKHDSFFKPIGPGRAIERFEGDLLIQQEPDASSFPNGGIRNTFEARGYTAWDPSSPAFIMGKTLCIPCVFLSYTGESLDYKMPLLKALAAVDKAAVDVCQYFDKNVTKVNATLGWEQEYFLIDRSHYNARPDIMMTGRALFGQPAAKGQQLDDHYFGAIPARASAYMRDFEIEAVKLGIPVTTRHNEVAPNQFECAPMFEECNLANDHNQLLIDLMEKVARKHNLKVLFHEKPFLGVNGSGKHNNWSLSTNTGVNLLAPGKNPKSNLQFLTFFINTIAAINKNADLLRASVASPSNEFRLGANEAPPAIMSVFIGTYLSNFLDEMEKNIKAGKMTPKDKTEIKLNIGKIPQILLDNTDRNRTSPFAFTGNKFEFRAVGSSQNCAQAMFVLNTIIAKQLKEFKVTVDARIEKGEGKDEAILKELQKLIKASKRIRFEGNGYGEEWVEEASKRGLSNHKDTPSALEVWSEKWVIDLFEEMDVLTKREVLARQEIEFESYIMKVQIESRVMNELSQNQILPATIDYQNKLLTNVKNLHAVLGKEQGEKASEPQLRIINKISEHLNELIRLNYEMLEARKVANKIDDERERAHAYAKTVKTYFDGIRYHADKLEWLVEDELWPLTKYRELLSTK